MRCKILHENRGRLRIHVCRSRLTPRQADLLETWLQEQETVTSARVFDRTGDAVILYRGPREELLALLGRFRFEDEALERRTPENTGRELRRSYQARMVSMIAFRLFRQLFLPGVLRRGWTLFRAVGFFLRGIRSLAGGKLRVEVLDAISIGVSILRGDYSTADSVMFLLGIGELLEEWSHKKSVGDLARSMALNVERVWLVTEEGDVLTPVDQIEPGSRIRVHAGSLIPLDGRVLSGEALVNQASLTGESVAAERRPGSTVYAGTVVEEGECVIQVSGASGESRYDRIVAMIEDSQKLSSETETRAARLADRLVPYSLLGTAFTYLLTRNTQRAVSILMVDFSCALKLAMPLSFLSAMSEAGRSRITVKGGKYLEAAARADTMVFDKTGTLTMACPRVAKVVPFGAVQENEALRLAACLEEHFPHSVANAVVRRAEELNLSHQHLHAEVEYLVAHGIASTVEGRRCVIGSYHFVFEDEHCLVPEGEEDRFAALPPEYSHLYLAIGGVLAAVICIADPLRPEAREVLSALRTLGISRLVMMTGDSERTAAAIAREVGVDDYRSEVLPEDKAAFIEAEHQAGRVVLMVGDGVNDTPALSLADAGIAISDGAAIAREVADITIAAEDLRELVRLRALALALRRRVQRNFRFVMGFNGSLMVLGALGILPPTSSALLHNLSTLGVSLKSMTPLLRTPPEKKSDENTRA